MNTVRVDRHDRLGTWANPAPAAIDAADLWKKADTASLGHAHFAYPAEEMAAYATADADETLTLFLAYEEDVCVGFLRAVAPRHDNRHHLHCEVRTLPDRDAVEILELLWPRLLDYCREDHRTSMTFWEPSLLDHPTLSAATSAGAVDSSPVTEWLVEQGFILDQVEIVSTLQMDAVDRAVTAGLPAEGYRLRTWVGPTPPDLLDGMAALRARLNIDAPHGNRPIEEEHWDAERIRAYDAQTQAANRMSLWAVALNEVDEPVAYTTLECPVEPADVAFQMDTFVRSHDRGHGLGLAVKVANLRQLHKVKPDVARVHTWNAGENQWMLAINRQLGFVPASALGAWERAVTR